MCRKAIGRIAVIADAAHSFGAKQNGKMSGEIADFTSFSFHAVKNLTTAEGGAVTWRSIDGIDDEYIYTQLVLDSLHGQSKDALSKMKAGSWEYDIKTLGYKCNMTDIMASLGLVQLRRYDAMLARRKEIIEKYNASLLILLSNILFIFLITVAVADIFTSLELIALTRSVEMRLLLKWLKTE